MGSADIRIALISTIAEEREFYQSCLERYAPLTIESFKTISQFKENCVGKKYSGIITDMYTIVCASTEEKDFFFSLNQAFPVMRVRRGTETDDIVGQANTKNYDELSTDKALETFLQTDCGETPPRGVRIFERKKILLQIHFFLSPNDPPLQSKLLDLSQGGCYILSPNPGVSEQDRVWITIDDLKDQNLIACLVRWKKNLIEQGTQLLGLGTQFEEITPEQQTGILEIIKTITGG